MQSIQRGPAWMGWSRTIFTWRASQAQLYMEARILKSYLLKRQGPATHQTISQTVARFARQKRFGSEAPAPADADVFNSRLTLLPSMWSTSHVSVWEGA